MLGGAFRQTSPAKDDREMRDWDVGRGILVARMPHSSNRDLLAIILGFRRSLRVSGYRGASRAMHHREAQFVAPDEANPVRSVRRESKRTSLSGAPLAGATQKSPTRAQSALLPRCLPSWK
jgi:hypothetical protein